MAFVIRCSDCREKIAWEAGKKFPQYCPACGVFMGEERADDDVVMPFVRTSARTQSIDSVYRDMERGSEARAQMAADMVGAPVAEMSSLKITNMRDNQRQGDYPVEVPVENSVTQAMKQIPMAGFGNSREAGAYFSEAVSVGAGANAGARFQSVLRERHANFTGGQGVSEIPTVEMLNRGYRRRV